MTGDLDHLTGVELMPAPAIMDEVIGGGHLHVPLHHVPIGVLRIEVNERMGLNKLEVRYSS